MKIGFSKNKKRYIILYIISSFLIIFFFLFSLKSYDYEKDINNFFSKTKNEYNYLLKNNDDIKTILAYKLYHYYNKNVNKRYVFLSNYKDLFDIEIEHSEDNVDYIINIYSRFLCEKENIGSIIDYKDNICSYNIYYDILYEEDVDGDKILYSSKNIFISSNIVLLNKKFNIDYKTYKYDNKKLGFDVYYIILKKLKEHIYELNDLEDSIKSNKLLLKYF